MLLGYSEWYKKYLFYAMLKKEFNFENDFNELDAGAFGTKYKVEETSESSTGYSVSYTVDSNNETFQECVTLNDNDEVVVTNHRDAAPIAGITDNTPKGLGLIGSIVVEIAAIAFVLKKKRQLKM